VGVPAYTLHRQVGVYIDRMGYGVVYSLFLKGC